MTVPFIASLLAVGVCPLGAQEPAFISVDEMEGDVAARWRDVGGLGRRTLEPDEKVLKEGELAGRWDTDSAAQAILGPRGVLGARGVLAGWTGLGWLRGGGRPRRCRSAYPSHLGDRNTGARDMRVSRTLTVPFIASLLAVGVCPLGAQEPAFISVDEMEGDVAARWRDVGGLGRRTLEPDEKVLKEGELAGRWDTDSAAQAIYLAPPDMPSDWEQLGALEMWVHSVAATGAVFAVALYSENPDTEGEDYYRCLVPVDWEGWRLFHLEPRSFAVARKPAGWRKIDTLRFAIGGWNDLKQVPGTVLRFDALRLVRSLSTPEHRLLFEPDTDWCAWWPLPYATTPTKTGRYVSDWYPAEDGASVVNRSVARDWSGSVYLNLWVYCEETAGMTLVVAAGSDRMETPEHDGYETTVDPNWVGWKLVALPLSGFQRRGDPLGWQSIDELRLTAHQPKERNVATRICLDDIWLSAVQGVEGGAPDAGGGGPKPPVPPIAPSITAPGDDNGKTPAAQPTDTQRLLEEALEAKRRGDLELAFTKYIAVLLKDPKSVDAHWGLAWVLAAKGEKEAAIEHFQQVAALSDDPARVRDAKAAVARLKAGGKP